MFAELIDGKKGETCYSSFKLYSFAYTKFLFIAMCG
jgi:hypothetical protein